MTISGEGNSPPTFTYAPDTDYIGSDYFTVGVSDGSLIDSPGIREFGLWHMTREQVEQGFREFRPFLGHCRFRDCKHEQEPDCAILAAAAQGAISAERLDSYRRIVTSLDET